MTTNDNLTPTNIRTGRPGWLAFELAVTLNGETRQVEFTMREGDRKALSCFEFASRIGSGMKHHRCTMTAWANADGTFKASRNTMALNRSATIIGFADAVPTEFAKSQHRGSAI